MRKSIGKSIQSVLCAAAVITTGLVLTGCRTPAPETKTWHSPPDTRAILAPGDQVDIKFFYTPELNEIQAVRPDGNISLQLVGDVMAAGRTPAQLREDLEQKYSGLIEKPSVAVIARALNHRSVYIGGAVNLPGMIEMPGEMTALSAIIRAGSFNLREASVENVVVIRQTGAVRQSYVLDFRDELSGETPQQPFYLHPQDIVYVPRTKIVNVGQWIDQHINKIVPQFGFTYSYITGPTTVGLDTSAAR
jgi:protein involved in polysaccharide export with SLBB domain